MAERHQAEMIGNYAETVGELPKADLKAEWEKAVKYNESVTGTSVEDPFILGSGSVLPDNYKDVLNVEEKEGVMGYIEIPAIDVKIPIYHGVSEKVLRKGVGHMETTALPIGGKGTHSVLAAHICIRKIRKKRRRTRGRRKKAGKKSGVQRRRR